MTTASIAYGSSAALTISVQSLASSSTLLVGRASTSIDNTSDLAVDALVGGKVKTGTTTADTKIELWAYGSYDGTSYSGAATGTDAGLTIISQQKSLLRLLQVILVPDTTARTYTWGPISVANTFGGAMPKKWGVYITHNTGANLDSTAGNHEVKYTPVNYSSA